MKTNQDKWMEILRTYRVLDCATVEEFAAKYRKASRFTDMGDEYVDIIIASHHADIKELGYTAISRNESNTGGYITFIPKAAGE